MFQLQGWQAVLRDVILISIFHFLLRLIIRATVNFNDGPPSLFVSLGASILGLSLDVIAFCIIGVFVKGKMWVHLFWVYFIVAIVSLGRSLIHFYNLTQHFDIEFFVPASAPVILYTISVVIGGAIAALIRNKRKA